MTKKLYSLENNGTIDGILRRKINMPVLDKSYAKQFEMAQKSNSQTPFDTPDDRELCQDKEGSSNREKIKAPEITFQRKKKKNLYKNIKLKPCKESEVKILPKAAAAPIPAIYKVEDISSKHFRFNKPLFTKFEKIPDQVDTNRSAESKDAPLRSIFNSTSEKKHKRYTKNHTSKFSDYLRQKSILPEFKEGNTGSRKKLDLAGSKLEKAKLRPEEARQRDTDENLDFNPQQIIFKTTNDSREQDDKIKYYYKRNLNMSVELQKDSSRENLHEDYHINLYSIPHKLKAQNSDERRKGKLFKSKYSQEVQNMKFDNGTVSG
ncbi:unnamed protein product [Moneuplotes crassus]|uniref:Uncharacterized protein n=1 Tax=Euplotes crassus TaxID=5936 RepID=A0AAD1UBU4_EUPCR|nr:unnamed protein product [Moneuplotes crassus]